MSTKKDTTVIQPLGDRVLIRELSDKNKETTTKSGIIIPMTVDQDKGAKRGEVIAVGQGKYEHGIHIAVEVKKGDTVLFTWGEKITLHGNEYYIVREGEIMAVIKE